MLVPILEGGVVRGSKICLDLEQHYNRGLEFVFLRKGHALWSVEQQDVAVQAGDVFFTLPWEKHGGAQRLQWGIHLDWVVLDVGSTRGRLMNPPGLPMAKQTWRRLANTLMHTTIRCLPVPPETGSRLESAIQLWLSNKQSNQERMSYHLGLFLLEVGEAIESHSTDLDRHPLPPSYRRVQHWVHTIYAQPENKVSLSEAAAACQLKRSHFSNMVKSMTGDSPLDFVNRVRIETASNMLGNYDRSITRIAFDCGFESSQYFSRVFRAVMNCSPTEYRRQLTGRIGQPK